MKGFLLIIVLFIGALGMFSNPCIADETFKRMGWITDQDVDDLTDEIKAYRAILPYRKKSNHLNNYMLFITCYFPKKEIDVMISVTTTVQTPTFKFYIEDVTVEYRFNQEPVLTEVWAKNRAIGDGLEVRMYRSHNSLGFAHELLRVMDGDKTQFRFREREILKQTLHFDLQDGAPFVRGVLGKCEK